MGEYLMPTGGEAIAIPTDIPGLFDLIPPDGSEIRDLTVGQIRSICAQNGWPLPVVRDER